MKLIIDYIIGTTLSQFDIGGNDCVSIHGD